MFIFPILSIVRQKINGVLVTLNSYKRNSYNYLTSTQKLIKFLNDEHVTVWNSIIRTIFNYSVNLFFLILCFLFQKLLPYFDICFKNVLNFAQPLSPLRHSQRWTVNLLNDICAYWNSVINPVGISDEMSWFILNCCLINDFITFLHNMLFKPWLCYSIIALYIISNCKLWSVGIRLSVLMHTKLIQRL